MNRSRRDLGPVILLLACAACCAAQRAFSQPGLAPEGQTVASGAPLPVEAIAPAPGDVPNRYGYLYQPSYSVDHLLRPPVRPYVPQAGDIFLSTDQRPIARLGHLVGRSGAPHHSGILFALPDGGPALLEGGPNGTFFVRVRDFPAQAASYFPENRLWVRQRSVPLTPEQSDRLTAFALAAADRRFAVGRLALQGNPLTKTKGPLRTRLFGRPLAAHFDPANPEGAMREQYFCSELVAEACVAAGILPPDTTRPTSMYPRELFFGSSRIPYIRDHLDMSAWLPPSRWTVYPGTEPDLKPRPFVEGDAGGIRSRP